MLELREVGQLFLEVLLEPHSGENCSGILSCSAESLECWQGLKAISSLGASNFGCKFCIQEAANLQVGLGQESSARLGSREECHSLLCSLMVLIFFYFDWEKAERKLLLIMCFFEVQIELFKNHHLKSERKGSPCFQMQQKSWLYTLLLCTSSAMGGSQCQNHQVMRGGDKCGNFLKRPPYKCLRKLCFINLKSALTTHLTVCISTSFLRAALLAQTVEKHCFKIHAPSSNNPVFTFSLENQLLLRL